MSDKGFEIEDQIEEGVDKETNGKKDIEILLENILKQITILPSSNGEQNAEGASHGEGNTIHSNGDTYQGSYKEGLRWGSGCYVSEKNKIKYSGEWKNGLKHGKGIFEYPDNSIYHGDWKRDLKHGFGEYKYSNGDKYSGSWAEGKRHGVGTYKYFQQKVSFKATWIEDQRKGPIEIISEQFRYYGDWQNESPRGPGIFTFKSKYMIPGYWKNTGISKIVSEARIDEQMQMVDQPNSSEWFSKEVLPYNNSNLPQEPIKLHIEDSTSSICSTHFITDLVEEIILDQSTFKISIINSQDVD